MKIVIFGAGAIGSFFGGLLSKKNDVTLISRKPHVDAIKKDGLRISGKTNETLKINAVTNVSFTPDLLIITVKSYDTETAIKQASKIIGKNTVVLSLQNGLGNIENISKYVNSKNIIAGTTSHGVIFSKPGVINHTGYGDTLLGELDGKKTERIKQIVKLFNNVKIKTNISSNIFKEIWIKAIVNSSINPLTVIFQCKNGYLLKNPILEKLVERVCFESTNIAKSKGIDVSYNDIILKTKKIIRNTSENYSSMYQSFNKSGKTEIDSINGKLVEIGNKHKISALINECLFYTVNNLEK